MNKDKKTEAILGQAYICLDTHNLCLFSPVDHPTGLLSSDPHSWLSGLGGLNLATCSCLRPGL